MSIELSGAAPGVFGGVASKGAKDGAVLTVGNVEELINVHHQIVPI